MHRLKRRLRQLADGPISGSRFFGSGELRLAILSLLADAPGHGYQLMTRLEDRCGGAYRASAGTIYPSLQQLEDQDLVRSEPLALKKVYQITKKGSDELLANADTVDEIWRRADEWSEWGVLRDPDAAEVVGPAMRLAKAALKAVIKSRGDPQVVESIREILEDARTRIERAARKGKR